MDLSHPQSSLSLGFSSHSSPPQHTQIADNSISLQLHSSLRDPMPTHPSALPIPFQLLKPQTTENPSKEVSENGKVFENEFVEDGVEEIRLLGHSMCLKRRRDCDSSSSSLISMSNSLKRVSVEPDLKASRSAVQSWGDAPLQVADPDIFELMEKEKQRQYKGIELLHRRISCAGR